MKAGLDISLFERLASAGIAPLLLRTQYRCAWCGGRRCELVCRNHPIIYRAACIRRLLALAARTFIAASCVMLHLETFLAQPLRTHLVLPAVTPARQPSSSLTCLGALRIAPVPWRLKNRGETTLRLLLSLPFSNTSMRGLVAWSFPRRASESPCPSASLHPIASRLDGFGVESVRRCACQSSLVTALQERDEEVLRKWVPGADASGALSCQLSTPSKALRWTLLSSRACAHRRFPRRLQVPLCPTQGCRVASAFLRTHAASTSPSRAHATASFLWETCVGSVHVTTRGVRSCSTHDVWACRYLCFREPPLVLAGRVVSSEDLPLTQPSLLVPCFRAVFIARRSSFGVGKLEGAGFRRRLPQS